MIDSTPIVVIAGQVGTNFLGTDAFQEVDLVGITQPITKWSYQIRRAEAVSYTHLSRYGDDWITDCCGAWRLNR